MIKIVVAIFITLAFVGCSGKDTQNIKPKLIIGENLSALTLKDQFKVSHTLSTDTNKLIFAFSKGSAHTCNDFFVTQTAKYLQNHNTEFIADVSAAPSLIRTLFILPGLKDFKHIVLLLDDKNIAAPYRKGMNSEKIIVVFLTNGKITKIKSIDSRIELKNIIEMK